MRTIKFRVWDKNIPKNLTEAEQNAPTGMIVDWDYVSKSDYLQCGINGEYPIMQFTGLLDKNGKEIYEGDIIHSDTYNENYSIGFENGCFIFNIDKGSYDYLLALTKSTIKVIGNIYENREMLEHKDE